MPETQWTVAPLDDVMPWDFFSQMFNYRSYLDSITEGLKVKTVSSTRLINLIRAALYYYWGHYSGSAEHIESAVKLDPEFPYYQLRLAATLIKSSTVDDCRRAVEILGAVAERSMLFEDAFKILFERFPEIVFGCALNISGRAIATTCAAGTSSGDLRIDRDRAANIT